MTAVPSDRVLPLGRRARVRVPATSANLGPGFDCMGLALDWYDELEAEVVDDRHRFELTGEGSGQVPRDESHLVLATMLDGLRDLGCQPAHIALGAHNTIPHGRGLGSSAAAIVAGLTLAWGLARPGEPLDRHWACELSSRAEGHPDNACAAVLGGAVLAWREAQYQVVELAPVAGLRAMAWVPSFEVPTKGARGVLPDSVPRLDAVAQATFAAALVHALTVDASRLLFATQDRLHQRQRAGLMPSSADLMQRLRDAGVPATISGAGPTVLALGTTSQLAPAREVRRDGFDHHDLALGRGVELLPVRQDG